MYIVLNNGKKISGENWKELLENLKNSTFFYGEQSTEEYMAEAATRLKTLNGKEIQYDSIESFLKELEKVKILEIVRR